MSRPPRPQSQNALQSFFGLAGYYRRFIQNIAIISALLFAMKFDKISFATGQQTQVAFDGLKKTLIPAPLLASHKFDNHFIVETDASSIAVGAVLAQKQCGKDQQIQFAGRSLSEAERNYSVYERDVTTVVFGLLKFSFYLPSSQTFELITSHHALQYAFNKQDTHGRLA